MSHGRILTQSEAAERIIPRRDYVACETAFIDCKTPGSLGKLNYSIIGPGVTQSTDQVINLREPHGFNVGAAAMPHGVTNNLHVHYTAEVFVIFEGEWRFRWGPEGRDGEVIGRAGDVISMPPWIFRGFTNLGDESGWIFSCLGGDDTGGVIWHPDILNGAAEHGLYLTRENVLVDTSAGGVKPDDSERMTPMSAGQIAALKPYDVPAFLQRVVAAKERVFSPTALLDAALPGHGASLAPVINDGLNQDRNNGPKIRNPHGFSVEWLKIPAGGQVGPFKLDAKQVLLVKTGRLGVTFNADTAQGEIFEVADPYASVSVPAEVWRRLHAVDGEVELAVLTAGDGRPRLSWAAEIVHAAKAMDLAVDPNGYIAQAALLPFTPEPAL